MNLTPLAAGPANRAPTITSLVASAPNVVPGATVSLAATAVDPDAGDTMTYAWSASPGGGSFSAHTALSTVWTCLLYTSDAADE